MSLAVEMVGISKRFGSVQALSEAGLRVTEGTIHAVVGENGAGKTTLMKALYGTQPADTGSILIDNQSVEIKTSAQAIALGIGMVSQHYGIIPELTCLQNLILGAERGSFIDLNSAEARATELATKMGFKFDWNRDAANLSPAAAQKLEILKLLWRNARIMILDEPTAMLSPADGEALFQSLQTLTKEGSTVILVTHRLPEVFQYCSRVDVLRSGKKVAEKSVADTNPIELAEMIVGKTIEITEHRQKNPGEPLLQIENLTVKGEQGNEALKSVSLTIRQGEMVGIAGVDGSGQRELVRSLIGTAKVSAGTITFGEEQIQSLPSITRIEKGIRIIPEDRHAEGVIEEWSLEENGALGLQRMVPFARKGTIAVSARNAKASEIAKRFKTRHGGLDQPMRSLSGGNQQRFVAARALGNDPKLILAFQPARGLDLAATQDVYEGLRQECERGAAVLVVSYDLDELLLNCDRVVAMNRGELMEPKPGQELDRDVIGCLMVGVQ